VPKKVIFMGTPDFAVNALQELSNHFEVLLVITAPDKERNRRKMMPTPVKEAAFALKLPVLTPDNVNDIEIIEYIKKLQPDFLIEVAYGQLIKEDLLNLLPNRFLNIHPSLLPEYRGAAPIEQAILDGEKETGVSIMIVEKGLDSGDILYSTTTPIGNEDDIYTLSDKLAKQGAKDIIYVIKNYDILYAQRKKQGEIFTYAKKITKEMGRVNWKSSSDEVNNLVRALKARPGVYTFYGNTRIKIFNGISIFENSDKEPGTILNISSEGIDVACRKGIFRVTELQFPNKKKMSVFDFVKGNTLEKGIIFE